MKRSKSVRDSEGMFNGQEIFNLMSNEWWLGSEDCFYVIPSHEGKMRPPASEFRVHRARPRWAQPQGWKIRRVPVEAWGQEGALSPL